MITMCLALEGLKGCYELRGSWVLDLKATQQHIIHPLTQCMWCSACEAFNWHLCNPFHVCAILHSNPTAHRRGPESSGVLELLTQPNTRNKKKSPRNSAKIWEGPAPRRLQRRCCEWWRPQPAILTFSYLSERHPSQHSLRLGLSAPGYKDGGVSGWAAHLVCSNQCWWVTRCKESCYII